MANAFVKLESCFGKVKHSYIKGDNAKTFETLVREKEKENNIKSNNEILGMIVLDRSVDFLTALTSNYTYEGLIDDFFGINLSSIKIRESFIKKDLPKRRKDSNSDKNEKMVAYHLNSFMNNFYSQISCMNYLDAKKYLQKVRNYYLNLINEEKSGKKQSIEEFKKYTNELTTFKLEINEPLFANENIIYYIIDKLANEKYKEYIKNEQILLLGIIPLNLHLYYEYYISEKRDLLQILKLMVIECLTQGGIDGYNQIKRDILNIYGYQNIFLFRDLENLGWLKEKAYIKNLMDNSHEQVIKKLELVNYNANDEKIENCSYVMNGFCPLSLRLIEKGIEGKWNTIQEIIKKIPGEVSFPLDESEISKPNNELNTIFLVFVGGVTYTEIEGVRYLNRKFKEAFDKSKSKKPKRTQLIIVTTGILNSKKIFNNLGKKFKSIYTMKQFHEQAKKDK